MTSQLFTEEDFKRIEGAVTDAEKNTAGEIVVLVAAASDDYRWVPLVTAFAGIVVASAAVVVISAASHWPLHVWRLLEWQGVGALAGALLGFPTRARRFLVPSALAHRRVHRECLANFTAAGLSETRDRTGILLYLSELERRVEILADRGIHERVGNGYWRGEVDGIVRGIRDGRATEAVVEAVKHIGDALSREFPPRPDDTNELGNEVRRGPKD